DAKWCRRTGSAPMEPRGCTCLRYKMRADARGVQGGHGGRSTRRSRPRQSSVKAGATLDEVDVLASNYRLGVRTGGAQVRATAQRRRVGRSTTVLRAPAVARHHVQRARLAVRAKALGRSVLDAVVTVVTPETLLRWHHRLIAA